MTHRAYVNLWTSENSESALLPRFERLLETVPLSAARPSFTRLLVRAVSPAEAPLAEDDLRGAGGRAADVIALAMEYPHPDTEFEVEAYWDLWQPTEQGNWERSPARLLLLCCGIEYDDGVAVQSGQFEVDLGFEYLFTGDDQPQGTHEKIGQNIKQLFDWLRRVETTLPIERYQLWSEGEENLEARLDDILSLH